MTVLFAGGEQDAFAVTAGTVTENTTAGSFDSAYARCSINLASNATIDTPTFTSATTFWIHFEFQPTTGFAGPGNTFYNSGGTAVFKVTNASSGVHQMQYWNGSTFVNIGSTISMPVGNTVYVCDMKIVCGSSGSAEFYIGNSLVTSGSATMTSVTNIAKARLAGSNGGNHRYSQVICADVSTVAWKYHLKPPTGNGANTAWTGAFGDVDETSLNDVDYIESTSANDVETYTGAALTIGAGAVKAVVVSGRALVAATGPQNIQAAIRRGSTNYFSSNLTGLGAGFGPVIGIFETDPSTSAAWTTANAAAAATEFGFKSIT